VSIYNIQRRPVIAQLLGDFLGVWVHWRQLRRGQWRALPCLKVGCRDCARKLAPSAYGYAPALLARAGEQRLDRVILSIAGANQPDFPVPHRGRCYELVRNPRGSATPLSVTLRDDLTCNPVLPVFPVLPYVAQALRVTQADLATFEWDATWINRGQPDELTANEPLLARLTQSAPRPAPAMNKEECALFRRWREAERRGDREAVAQVRRQLQRLSDPQSSEDDSAPAEPAADPATIRAMLKGIGKGGA